jgi:phenylalanyl-tRNA synthetase beta chain
MKVSLNWLREFVALPASTSALVDLLTLAGVEVEGVHQRGADIPHVVVAQILESTQHPNADRLSVCKVNYGAPAPAQIVCGAKNYRVGDKVPLALPGAILPGDFKIKVGKLRGVESQGMMCSAKELGLGEGHEGLLILPADAPVGAPLSTLFPADVVLDLEITPNRPDLLSHYGIAREIAALSSVPLAPPPFAHTTPALDGNRITIEAPSLCPFYSARRIRGVKVGPSPEWLRTRLDAIGIRSINNIVDVTNYVMMEMGQPLHAFDESKLADGAIRVRPAAEGETFQALDGKTYTLTPTDLVIADVQKPAAIAGVMGGEQSGVTASTVDILLESALFNSQSVRRTSRRLGLASDSSYRFERGIDPATVLAASDRATQLIVQLTGGIAEPAIETAGQVPDTARTVALRPARCSAILGVYVPKDRISAILERFGLKRKGSEPRVEDATLLASSARVRTVTVGHKEPGADVPLDITDLTEAVRARLNVSGDQSHTEWMIPSFRPDLTREADLIEEVVRAFGIENIPGTVRSRPAPASPADAVHDFHLELRRRLAGQGYFEARTFSLISKTQSASFPQPDLAAIRNPLLEDQAVLRPSLIPGLLAALERNLRGGAKSIRLFELGRVFLAGKERVHLATILSGDALSPSWSGEAPRKTALFDLKGALESLGLADIGFQPATIDGLLPAVRITVAGHAAGSLGQLPPAQLRSLDCTSPVSVFELDLTAARLRPTPSRIAPIPRFPAVTRDIAIIAASSVSHAQIAHVLRSANEPLLADIQLFDLFSDPDGIKVPAGQKSLAYSLTYRSADRTLIADEVNAAHARLKERLKAELHVNFRE